MACVQNDNLGTLAIQSVGLGEVDDDVVCYHSLEEVLGHFCCKNKPGSTYTTMDPFKGHYNNPRLNLNFAQAVG